MVKVLSPDIPSDTLIYYRRSLIPATDPKHYVYASYRYAKTLYGPSPSQLYNNRYADNYYAGRPYGANLYTWLPRTTTFLQGQFTRKKIPHEIPTLQNASFSTPSKQQRAVRDAFKKCVNCFNDQPYSGGVEPPALGPRNRSWWYDQAGNSGLWYYDYFIQQTWLPYFSQNAPPWCIVNAEPTFAVNNQKPDAIGETAFIKAEAYTPGHPSEPLYITRTFIKKPTDRLNASLIKFRIRTYNKSDIYPFVYGAYAVYNLDWDPPGITWNNQPPHGPLLSTATEYRPWYFAELPCPDVPAICIRMVYENVVEHGQFNIMMAYSAIRPNEESRPLWW